MLPVVVNKLEFAHLKKKKISYIGRLCIGATSLVGRFKYAIDTAL